MKNNYERYNDSFDSKRSLVKEQVDRLFNIFNQYKNKEQVEAWCDDLKQYDLEQVTDTVTFFFRNATKFPTFAEFTSKMPKVTHKSEYDPRIEEAKEQGKKRREDAMSAIKVLSEGMTELQIKQLTAKLLTESGMDKSLLTYCDIVPFRNQVLAVLWRNGMEVEKTIKELRNE